MNEIGAVPVLHAHLDETTARAPSSPTHKEGHTYFVLLAWPWSDEATNNKKQTEIVPNNLSAQ